MKQNRTPMSRDSSKSLNISCWKEPTAGEGYCIHALLIQLPGHTWLSAVWYRCWTRMTFLGLIKQRPCLNLLRLLSHHSKKSKESVWRYFLFVNAGSTWQSQHCINTSLEVVQCLAADYTIKYSRLQCSSPCLVIRKIRIQVVVP